MARDPKQILAGILADRADLIPAASAIFDYAQYLLDDDERLTKTGALDGAGRDLLRARALESLGGPADAPPDDDAEDADDADDEAEVDDEVDAAKAAAAAAKPKTPKKKKASP